MKSSKISLENSAPFLEVINGTYNGNLSWLIEALLKGSFYASVSDPWEREKLRKLFDRVSQIALSFDIENQTHLEKQHLKKFFHKIDNYYKGSIENLEKDLQGVIDLLNTFPADHSFIKFNKTQFERYIYHLKVLMRAIDKLKNPRNSNYILPYFNFSDYSKN